MCSSDLAASAAVHILKVLWQGYIVWECRNIVITTWLWAPWARKVPPWSFGHNRLWGAKHFCWCTVPTCLGVSAHHHVWILVACHLATSKCIVFSRASVVFVGLMCLSACSDTGISLTAILLRCCWITPVVLVACVITDGFLHALTKESGNVDQPVIVVVAFANPQFCISNAIGSHDLNCRNHIFPLVQIGWQISTGGGLIHKHSIGIRGLQRRDQLGQKFW